MSRYATRLSIDWFAVNVNHLYNGSILFNVKFNDLAVAVILVKSWIAGYQYVLFSNLYVCCFHVNIVPQKRKSRRFPNDSFSQESITIA